MNYKDGYYYLFNQLTDLIDKLQAFQVKAEEICIESEEEENNT